MRPAAEECNAEADIRECELVQREEAETLKRKRQDTGPSHSRSASSLMTWADRLPEPTPQPPPQSALAYRQISPVIHEKEEEEYIVYSCS